jgi:DNA-3-methyladenine glycosylase II
MYIVMLMIGVESTNPACKDARYKPVRKVVFQLKPVPPFRLDLTVWALRRQPHNLVDRWDGRTYRRVILVCDQPVEMAVTQTAPVEAPLLRVEARTSHSHWEWASVIAAHLVKMLGLHADLAPFYRLAGEDDRLGPLVERWRGLKPPRFPSVFEALVNAIACQQLSLTQGIHLLNRLAATYAPALPGKKGPRPAFPRPVDLTGLRPEALLDLGFSRNKGTALIELAQILKDSNQDLENLNDLEESEAMTRLLAFRGVGRWSAEYVLLRGLGRWSVFPGDDVGARRHLQTWLHLADPLDYQGVRRHLARWHPYGGLIYFHFLLNRLAEEGHLS